MSHDSDGTETAGLLGGTGGVGRKPPPRGRFDHPIDIDAFADSVAAGGIPTDESIEQRMQRVARIDVVNKKIAEAVDRHTKASSCCARGFWKTTAIFALIGVYLCAVFLAAVVYGLYAEGQSIQQTKEQAIHMVKKLNDSQIIEEVFAMSMQWKAANNTDKTIALVDKAEGSIADGLALLARAGTLTTEIEDRIESADTTGAIEQFNQGVALAASSRASATEALALFEAWLHSDMIAKLNLLLGVGQ